MIDWFGVICELQRNKISMIAQSKIIGVSERTIANWRDGAEPKYSDGTKLIELWVLVTHKNENELPMKRVRS